MSCGYPPLRGTNEAERSLLLAAPDVQLLLLALLGHLQASSRRPNHLPRKRVTMPGRGAPTFLKRQKEQQRQARAIAKRAARQARRENRAAEAKADQGPDEEIPAESNEQDSGPQDDSKERGD